MGSQYEQFFKQADTDKNGYLTLDELTSIMQKKGYKESNDKIKAMFSSVDLSGDHKVSFDEYMIAMGQVPPAKHKEASMRSCFRSFDKDGSGTIDRKELETALKECGSNLTPAEIDRMLKMVDKDGSGTLDYEEFIREVFGK